MVKADPQLAWLKDAEKRGDVDWRQVREIHDSFKYSNSGLGPASQIIIAILMAAVIGPMAMGAMAGATGTAVAAGTMTASTAAGLSAAAGAVAAGAATNATVSAVNNRGNLGAVIKDVTSSDAVKGYVISGVTAGVTAGYFDDLTGTKTNTGTGKVNVPLNSWKSLGQFAANQTLQSGTSLALSRALGLGGNVSDALKSALFNTLAAASFNAVGDYTQGVLADGSAPKIAIQAMVGGLLAEATGGDFKTGALAAGANEALVGHLNDLVNGDEKLLTMSSQIIGVLAATTQSSATGDSLQSGAWVAQNATQYNYLNHQEVDDLVRDLKGCRGASDSSVCRANVTEKYEGLSDKKTGIDMLQCEGFNNCNALRTDVEDGLNALDKYDLKGGLSPEEQSIVRGFQDKNQDDVRLTTQKTTQATNGEIAGIVLSGGLGAGAKVVGEAGLIKVTPIEFLPKATRNSAGQIEANITQGSAIKILESTGYKKTMSRDGSVTVLTNGEKTYRFYPSSTSTGQPSASLTVGGLKKPSAKIRFLGE